MERKIYRITFITILLICACITFVSAYSFNVSMSVSKETINEGEEIAVVFRVSNLDVGTNGINAVSGYLQYDKTVFEEVTDVSLDGLNSWVPTYNTSNGKLTLTKTTFTKEDEDFVQVVLKAKTGTNGKQGEVSFTDIEASNTAQDISAGSISKTIKIGQVAESTTQAEQTTQPETASSTYTYTDFSKAKFNLVKQGTTGAQVEITGVEPISGHYYYGYIQSGSTKPDITSTSSSSRLIITYDSSTKKLLVPGLAKYVELNQELHLYIAENPGSDSAIKLVSEDNKLTRYAEPKNNEGFYATHLAYSGDQIVTTFTHDNSNTRKLTVKVGKITDKNILSKIKDKNASGMTDLLSYAKSSSADINKTITLTNRSFIEYNTGSDSGLEKLSISNLENNAYYYLYVVADSENGKYITQEAATLALANKKDNGEWYLFFYGANDFKWGDLGTTDGTTAKKTIPATGESLLVTFAIITLAGTSVFLYRKNQNYKGI